LTFVNNFKVKKSIIVVFVITVVLALFFGKSVVNKFSPSSNLKLYWFIPDGMRAEPDLFTVYKWADEGKLPNIKKLMQSGSYGYSFPNFPSHTPTNFAALLTGSYPEVNGVDDGPMRAVGKPLDSVAVPGFRSTAKKVSPIWKTMEDAGMKVAILSVPGSTPPEINKGVVIRGRWGGWGADFAALNFEQQGNLTQRIMQGRASRFFYFGPQLTNYVPDVKPIGWENTPQSFSDPYEVTMNGWGTNVYAYVYDTTNDGKVNYDKVAVSLDKKKIAADIGEGQWGDWTDITLKWKSGDNTIDVPTSFRPTVVKLGDGKFFRMRLFYNNLNSTTAYPADAAQKMINSAGPMVDFVDNFPAQLIYYPEDKTTFQQESGMTFNWHTKAVGSIVKNFSPDIVIQDIYSPNQMLTSKWWMGYIDPKSTMYNSVTPQQRQVLWSEVSDMYVKLDNIIGEIIKNSNKNTYIVLSSDHGAVPLNKFVNLNNLFAKKGWLKFKMDPKTGEPIIDWKNSSVIYLKMAHVYINPKGLSGNYIRATGPEYENLRNEVVDTLQNLTDSDGTKPLTDVVKWENAKDYMKLDTERIGDLVIANTPGYGFNEEMNNELKIFSAPTVTGYKQAIKAQDVPGMWTPFIISGPGIKKNNYLGDKPFTLIDQYPTLMKALNIPIPDFVQGKSLPVFTDGR
jgi:predicted AlkP superfamily phosphohydrolase/phosphomutase